MHESHIRRRFLSKDNVHVVVAFHSRSLLVRGGHVDVDSDGPAD